MTTTAHLEQALPASPGLDTEAMAAAVFASQAPARAVLSARLLGGCWVTIDHRPVPLGNSRRTRALLAFLVDRGPRPVPRDLLMEVFWPESSPEAARNSLHVAMHGLRKALAQAWRGAVVECRGDTYRLSEVIDVWSDAAELERRSELGAIATADGHLDEAVAEYETGLALYGGEFMADDPYLEWAMPRREELRLRAVDCAEQLSELHLRRGDLRRALAISSQVLREEPCHEPAARRLMIAYARLGQPHMALRLYGQIVQVLGRELGVAAAQETVALADQIRARTPV
jgi:SARP family transcriptional regulator, regulator of embCAB operon